MGRTYRPYSATAHRQRKLTDYRKSQGIDPFIPDAEVREYIKHLRQWLSIAEIADRAGLPAGTVQQHTELGEARGSIRPWNAEKILAVRIGPDDLTRDERLLGAQRILRGLMALGFTTHCIAIEIGLKSAESPCKVNSLPNLNKGSFHPSVAVYRGLIRAAEKLEGANPLDFGIALRGMKNCQAKARNSKWPVVGAWDLDTVHLEDAVPEWTGACGTMRGWQIHYRQHIPVCPPCKEAKRVNKAGEKKSEEEES